MKNKTKTQKGFAHVPLLATVATSVLVISLAITGVILYKQEQSALFTTSVSQALEGMKDAEPEIEPDELQPEAQSLIKELDQEDSQAEQELEQIKLESEKYQAEAEKAKQNLEQAKAEMDELKIKQDNQKIAEEQQRQEELQRQQEAQRMVEEEQKRKELEREQESQIQLKIENCKSKYTQNKSEGITYFEIFELPKLKHVAQIVTQVGYQECVEKCLQDFGVDPSSISGETYAKISSGCTQFCGSHWSLEEYLAPLKKQGLDKIEQQLQQEYQQCLSQ